VIRCNIAIKEQIYSKGDSSLVIEKAIQLPLEVWQDPQGDVILNVSERECNVFFGCWNEDSSPADFIAKITFEGCRATKFTHSEYLDYEVNISVWRSHHSVR
jgi:hypothetical protein